jgi:hypothetical protein
VETVLLAHSFLRFGVLAAVLAGLSVTAVACLQKRAASRMDGFLATLFLGLYDIQALLGLVLLASGRLRSHLHATVMLLGVVFAHILFRSVRSAPPEGSWSKRLLFYLLPFLCILVGLAVIGHLPV